MTEQPIPRYHILVESGNWSELLKARKEGASWDNLLTRTGTPALGVAILCDSTTAVKLLLENGAPIATHTLFSGERWSPLWAAINQGNGQIIEALLAAGADPDEPHPITGAKPIDVVSEHGDNAATVALCKYGARPNTNNTPSALWWWIHHLTPNEDNNDGTFRFPDSEPVMALIQAGARINAQKQHSMGMDPLTSAKRKWAHYKLSPQDERRMQLVLSALERAALMEQAQNQQHTDRIETNNTKM